MFRKPVFRLAVVHFKTMETHVLSDIEVKSMDPDNRLLFVAPHAGSLFWCVPCLLWAWPVGDIHHIPKAKWYQVLYWHRRRVSEPPSTSTDPASFAHLWNEGVKCDDFFFWYSFPVFCFAKKSYNCSKKIKNLKKPKQYLKKNKIFCFPETTAKNSLVNLLSHTSLRGLHTHCALLKGHEWVNEW